MTRYRFSIVCGTAFLLFLTRSSTWGQIMIDPNGADWVFQMAGACPTQWQITPAAPSSSDIVTFRGPIKSFSNPCAADNFYGGEPALMVNGLSRVAEIVFIPPDGTIYCVFDSPVCGLQGSFGPLKFGTWTLKCQHPELTFELKFDVDGVATTRDVIYVDADLISLTPDGFAWETAFSTIQQALAVAEDGSVIKVAQGTYYPGFSQDRKARFQIPSGISLLGGFRGSPSVPIGPIVFGLNDIGTPPLNSPDDRDIESYPTILSGDLNNDDTPDFAHHHDNVYHVLDISWTSSDTLIEGFTITGGFANGFGDDSQGGALFSRGSEAIVRQCCFERNAAITGGAVANRNGYGSFVNCIFEDNLAVAHGGAMTNFGGYPLLVNCLLVANRVPGDIFLGGAAISNTTTHLVLVNCTIADNESMSGGALSFFGDSLWPASAADITNTVLWNGGNEITVFDGSQLDITYCDIQGGGFSGAGNIDQNPLFMGPGHRDNNGLWQSGDYHIQGWSPCLDAGDPLYQPDDTDIDGDPRVLGGIVDIGIDEILPMAPPPK